MSHRSIIRSRVLPASIVASILVVASASSAQAPAAAAPAPSPAAPAPPPAAPAPAPAAADAAPPAAWTEDPSAAPAGPPAGPPAGDAAPAPSPDGAPPAGDAAAVGVELGGPANPSDEAYTPAPPEPLKKYGQWDLGFEIGVRNVVATDPSYDPYSTDDVLTSFALAATWMPLHFDIVTLGLVGEWNPGGSTGDARGDATSLFVHRASVGVQGRLALGRRVYLSAKVAPSLLAVSGNIDDPAVDRPLEADAVTWGLDAVGGAAVLIARAGDPDAPAFRLWVVGEVGYAFAGSTDMTHAPAEVEDDPRRYGGIALASLDTSGVVNRFGVAMTF